MSGGASPLRHILTGLAVTALIVAASPFTGSAQQASAVSGTLGFTIGPSSELVAGDAFTITPTGTYLISTDPYHQPLCTYGLSLSQDVPAGQVIHSHVYGVSEPTSAGKCPSATFRLPNYNRMWAVNTPPARVEIMVMAHDQFGVRESDAQQLTFSPSSSNLSPTSTIPAVMWTVTDTKPVAGQLVSITIHRLGFAAKHKGFTNRAASHDFQVEGVRRTAQQTATNTCGSCQVVFGSMDDFWTGGNTVSFTQPAWGFQLSARAITTVSAYSATTGGEMDYVLAAGAVAQIPDPPAATTDEEPERLELDTAEEEANANSSAVGDVEAIPDAAIPNTATAPRQGAEVAASATIAWSDAHIDNAIGGSVFAAGLGLVMLLLMGWARGHRQERFGPEPKRGLLTRIFRREQRTIDPFSRKLKN